MRGAHGFICRERGWGEMCYRLWPPRWVFTSTLTPGPSQLLGATRKSKWYEKCNIKLFPSQTSLLNSMPMSLPITYDIATWIIFLVPDCRMTQNPIIRANTIQRDFLSKIIHLKKMQNLWTSMIINSEIPCKVIHDLAHHRGKSEALSLRNWKGR